MKNVFCFLARAAAYGVGWRMARFSYGELGDCIGRDSCICCSVAVHLSALMMFFSSVHLKSYTPDSARPESFGFFLLHIVIHITICICSILLYCFTYMSASRPAASRLVASIISNLTSHLPLYVCLQLRHFRVSADCSTYIHTYENAPCIMCKRTLIPKRPRE
ncbi:hypothetical protein BCR34DRAFT_382886 [Clohesyomyces aquaticus]|uniref:Uncharacterized protein n=1 Tax=Clohesyomyces aquaticus TaxID=1231657 RepID=A0A1Y1ZGF8_9PLEO|nr:hypothetical protein BCR34DRAFT_382886 [Clohesyomyces aquaticus]